MKISYNAPAMRASNALNASDSKVSQSLQRLSSGLKVTASKDNPSGYAIGRRMNTQITGLGTATQSSNNGISVIETADGALAEVHEILQRMNELAVKGETGTLTTSDRKMIEAEVKQLKSEITVGHKEFVVCDAGLKWLSILPKDDFYCITAMMNQDNNVLVWYIDMIAAQGIDADGIPYFDDLYLDLVVYPNGEIMVDDMDELEEALRQADITQEQFDLAVHAADTLKNGLLKDIHSFRDYTSQCYKMAADKI